jgi:hypothetical protein
LQGLEASVGRVLPEEQVRDRKEAQGSGIARSFPKSEGLIPCARDVGFREAAVVLNLF